MQTSRLNICLLLITIASFSYSKLYTQNTNFPHSTGSVKGKAKDSVYNFMLTSATVAIYKDADSSLLKYTFPDNFGEFTLTPLPVGVPLRLIITHVGYRPLQTKITIEKSGQQVDLDTLFLYQEQDEGKGQLDEVVIKSIAPMRMNGDTLEFNADAFKLDSNATAEDLMRRLPGFTIWGDGDITFNGKKINQVLVNGKPFMGTNSITVATQNLPKNALDKIQVYQQRDEKNPLDSTMFANIKLKEDKQMGYFGKLGGGFGTNMRYTIDGALNGFNKKLQISTVGAVNNINKLAGDVDVLLKNSTFKGEGANIEYQSDFNMRGVNRPAAGGVKLQYDFIPDPAYQQSSRLNSGYFINHNQPLINNNTRTENFLTADTVFSRKSQSNTRGISADQNLNSRYDYSNKLMNFSFYSSISSNYDKSSSEAQSEQSKTGLGTISSNTTISENEIDKKGLRAGASFTNKDSWDTKRRVPKEFTTSYQFVVDESKGSHRNYSKYNSSVTPTNNKEFDRFYDMQNSTGINHMISASYPGIRKLIFNNRGLGGIEIGISGAFTLNNTTNKDRVLDKDTLSHIYRLNSYLTNDRQTQTNNLITSVNLSKTFRKGLTNRYNKWVVITVNLRKQYFSLNSSATQDIQNFAYWYTRFIPNASIEYSNHQYGTYEAKYNLNFSSSVVYPGVNNIAPLVDSSNQWYIPKGNLKIKPQERKNLALGYSFITRKSKNPLSISVNAAIGKYDHNITDSTLYDNAGVRTVYAINLDGNRYINGNLGVRKALEIRGKNTFELDTRYARNVDRHPQYINSILNISNSVNENLYFNIGIRHKDILNLKLEEGISWYKSHQTGFNNSSFKSSNQYSRFIGALRLSKTLLWSTNITYNKSDINSGDAVYYTIWNASATYRFLKGNRGEVKFSALDLLRQNKGIVNSISGNTQTFTISNVLQQYYMLTLSYYPRKFGKSQKNNR